MILPVAPWCFAEDGRDGIFRLYVYEFIHRRAVVPKKDDET